MLCFRLPGPWVPSPSSDWLSLNIPATAFPKPALTGVWVQVIEMAAFGGGTTSRGGFPIAIATQGTASNYLQRAPSPSGLADVVDLILDKGLVIDAYIRISVIGIELITIDARIVIASVDTYLRFAEQVNRLDLTETEMAGLPELQEKGAEEMTEGAIEGVEDKLLPDSLRSAAKGVAAAAAVGAAAVAAREIANRMGESDGSDDN